MQAKATNGFVASKWNSCYRARRAHNAVARDTARRAPVPRLPKAPDRACDSQGEPPKAKYPPKSGSHSPLATRQLAFRALGPLPLRAVFSLLLEPQCNAVPTGRPMTAAAAGTCTAYITGSPGVPVR